MEEKKLIANRIITPDGTMLWSRFTHDYVQYEDKNGEVYILDGGNDYIRSSVNKAPAIIAAVYDDEPWTRIRMVFLRGVYMPNGQIYWIPLYKLSDKHLENILKYNDDGRHAEWNHMYENEIEFRKENCIVVEDREYTEEDAVKNIIPYRK